MVFQYAFPLLFRLDQGELSTYWLEIRTSRDISRNSESGTESGISNTSEENISEIDVADIKVVAVRESGIRKQFPDKTERLIAWNVDVLLRLLQEIVARRQFTTEEDYTNDTSASLMKPFDEVKEIISLPELREYQNQGHPAEVKISDTVAEQLRVYVANIAASYNDNPFHNFEHVSTRIAHVVHKIRNLYDLNLFWLHSSANRLLM